MAFALPDRQFLESLEVAAGTTVASAIRQSGVSRRFPGIDLERLQAGIWGDPVERDRVLADGDRVELYRPLERDPRETRRLKAGV